MKLERNEFLSANLIRRYHKTDVNTILRIQLISIENCQILLRRDKYISIDQLTWQILNGQAKLSADCMMQLASYGVRLFSIIIESAYKHMCSNATEQSDSLL